MLSTSFLTSELSRQSCRMLLLHATLARGSAFPHLEDYTPLTLFSDTLSPARTCLRAG